MKEKLQEKDLRNIFQKYYDLAVFSNQMKFQQKLIDKVLKKYFKDSEIELIHTNETVVYEIDGYFSNGEIYSFDVFCSKFKKALKEIANRRGHKR